MSGRIVDVGSSDDEATPSPAIRRSPASESRCFWKAGSYDVISKPPTLSKGELEHARVHPKFLHSNATSHKWAFGAIAELLDNAVDEICNGATYVKVDRIYNARDHSPALLFLDDGGGMDPECMRQCMSLGYSSKKTNTTIGQYGNGFKTSTMRLGADVIVFSRKVSGSRVTQSIGLLSYTFLRKTGQDDIIVPMVDFEIVDGRAQPIIYSSKEDWIDNFKIILEWSPFSLKEDLMQQFEDIGPHGTKVIIFNLWLNDDGIYELDFDDDEEDIRLRDEAKFGGIEKFYRDATLQAHISYRLRYSLRAYTSILYLKKFTNFQILLRGIPVQHINIAHELQYAKVIPYRPNVGFASKEGTVDITVGFLKEAPSLKAYGFNVYHKNRLIMPFWKVLHESSSRGKGVVGVLEANFIEPAHDKQDFERTALFIRLEARLKQILLEYWKNNMHLIGLGVPQPVTGLAVGLCKNMPVDETAPQAVDFNNEMPGNQPIIGLAALNRPAPTGNIMSSQNMFCEQVQFDDQGQAGLGDGQQSVDVAPKFREGSIENLAHSEISESVSVEQLCEENIQLFLRCEEYRQKQKELNETIANLEKEIAEKRRKCSQLASQMDIQRKQKTIEQ